MDRREFLYVRKNRCVGQLLEQLEQRVFSQLSEDDQQWVRGIVKAKIDSYHRDALDAMENTSDDTRFNALALKAKDRVQERQ